MSKTIVAHTQDDWQVAAWSQLADRVRRFAALVLNALMKEEQDRFIGCGHYERSPSRRGRRNGYEERWLDTQWGPLRLRVPKVRDSDVPFRPRTLSAYQRRQGHLERVVVAWVASGMSTRAVSRCLRESFGALLSPGGVSRVVAKVDRELEAFRARRLVRGLRYLYLDGKHGKVCVPSGGRGRGCARKAVLLLAWGMGHDGREGLVDFAVAEGESVEAWDRFLRRLRERGVVEENRWGERLQLVVSDGDGALEAALALNYPHTPHQLCVFHKVRNLANHLVDASHRKAITRQAARIFDAPTRAEAEGRLRRWAERWRVVEPAAVRSLVQDADRLLVYYRAPCSIRRRVKTTNPLERFIAELDRKFERVGVFPSERSWERATYIVYCELVERGYAPLTRQLVFTRNT